MDRLQNKPVAEAIGQTAELFAAIKKAAGKVPNAYAVIGHNSPIALEAALKMDAALSKSSLSGKEIEIIRLSVSQVAGCDYCLAAHTMLAKHKGLSREAILALRHGEQSGDDRFDALATFVHTLVTTHGTVPVEVVDAVKAAGYSDTQIVDIFMAISSITFTNLFNRTNDTTVDFPAAD